MNGLPSRTTGAALFLTTTAVLALELLQATFGQVGGATDFFERRELADGGGWFDTHPGHDARVRHLRALAAERGWTVAPLTPYSVSTELCRGG